MYAGVLFHIWRACQVSIFHPFVTHQMKVVCFPDGKRSSWDLKKSIPSWSRYNSTVPPPRNFSIVVTSTEIYMVGLSLRLLPVIYFVRPETALRWYTIVDFRLCRVISRFNPPVAGIEMFVFSVLELAICRFSSLFHPMPATMNMDNWSSFLNLNG